MYTIHESPADASRVRHALRHAAAPPLLHLRPGDCTGATASAEHVLAGFGQADNAACEAHCAALCAGGTFTRFCRTCYRFLGVLC